MKKVAVLNLGSVGRLRQNPMGCRWNDNFYVRRHYKNGVVGYNTSPTGQRDWGEHEIELVRLKWDRDLTVG